MASQGWVEQGLALAMIATAGYCATCLVLPKLRRVTAHQDADAVHVVMAVAMAAMLLGVARPLWDGPLVLAFALPATWFAWRAVRSVRSAAPTSYDTSQGALGHLQLSVAGIAMIYMSGVLPGFGSQSAANIPATGASTPLPHDMRHELMYAGGSGGSVGVDFALAGAAMFAALAAFAFVSIGQLAASADSATSQVTSRLWPHRLTLCCQLAMAATMAHMVAVMV